MKQAQQSDFIENIKKEVKVQTSYSITRKTTQYFIQIPSEIARNLEVKKGDLVVMNVPLKNKDKYSIRFKRKIQ